MSYSSYSSGHAPYRASEAPPPPTLGDEIRTVFAVLVRDWLIIALCTAAMMVLMAIYVLATPAKYTASADLLLDPREKQVVNAEVVDSSFAVQSDIDTILLDSQVQVILSDPVIRKLISEENLASDAEFSRDGTAYADVQSAVRDALEVSRRTNTYILAIEFTTRSPEKSARLANRLAEIYMAQNVAAIVEATSGTAEALQGRLSELKAEASAANAAVETYKQENGLIGTQEMLISEQQLSDLNNQLSLAQVATTNAKANLDRANAAIKNGAITGDAALESEVVTQLQIDLSKLDAQQAQLSATLGPRHPQMTSITEQKAALQTAIQAEYRRIAERFKQEYAAAQQREQGIRDQVTATEARTASSNSASVELRELQREAAASQLLYETYLKRAKEVEEQVDLPTDTARIISPAIPPAKKSAPKTMLLMAAAAITGLGLGILVVWLRHILGGGDPSTPSRTASPPPHAGNDDYSQQPAVRPRAFVPRPVAASPTAPPPQRAVRSGPAPRAWQGGPMRQRP